MSDTKYNPANAGQTFNYDAPQQLVHITTQDKVEAIEKRNQLIKDTQDKLFEGLNYEQD